jgi:hypothetical protein
MATYDSTTTDESAHGRQSLDGSDSTLVSTTVPTGELWYVEGVYVTTDGSGDDSGLQVVAAIADSTTLDNAEPVLDRGGRGGTAGVDTTIADGAFAEVDAYASAGEEVRVNEVNESGSTGGYHYGLQARNVL